MYKRILVGMDGSQTSTHALDEAVRLARLAQATIHAVYVVDKTPIFNYAGYYDPVVLVEALRKDGRTALASAEAACRKAGVACEAELVETERMSEDVAEALQRYAERNSIELAVMGTHGRRGVRRIVLGSVAERFVRFSHCPVLLVRGTKPANSTENEG
ncbi:universal stress protein [Paraburkholderia sp. BL10I2N1]|uniref:universal stress protein n=1 Tax=Paraburkholderia sp. BL10I2N1 TaxID=1938796 RepID=UPI00105F30A0|nr:universal stress protein [Paraburkholderia sp. BL10I2N1]TDN63195.1 nucleotide-binding universal stress UspA family protein [Paraburkholderia sp. BL10I2N1]